MGVLGGITVWYSRVDVGENLAVLPGPVLLNIKAIAILQLAEIHIYIAPLI